MSYNKNKFQHNLKKAKRQNENERFLLNNIFSGYSKTLIEICNPKINEYTLYKALFKRFTDLFNL